MASIHPTALVDPRAKISNDVEIGPYAVIGPDVELGEGVVVSSHAVVTGHTSIGARTRIFSFAGVGGEPQDKRFSGESTRLVIGRDNVIRENVTIHVGTPGGGGCTQIGHDNFIMNSAHIGHDAKVGSNTIIASYCAVAGHVVIEDYVVMGAYAGVHQFCRVGESAMLAARASIVRDPPPFSMVAGDRARLVGMNVVGMKSRGFSRETMAVVKHAFHLVFQSHLRLQPALARVREECADSPEVARFVHFIENSKRGVIR